MKRADPSQNANMPQKPCKYAYYLATLSELVGHAGFKYFPLKIVFFCILIRVSSSQCMDLCFSFLIELRVCMFYLIYRVFTVL